MKKDFCEKIKDSLLRQIDELVDVVLHEESKKLCNPGMLEIGEKEKNKLQKGKLLDKSE